MVPLSSSSITAETGPPNRISISYSSELGRAFCTDGAEKSIYNKADQSIS